jgi:hypothetical protein
MTCNIAKKKLPSPGTRSEHGAKRKEKIVTDVLEKSKNIKYSRVTNNVTTVTFNKYSRVTNNVTNVTFNLRSKIEQKDLPGYYSH